MANIVTINNGGDSKTFTISPVLQKAVTLQTGSFPVYLWLARSGSNTNRNRNVTVTLANSALGILGSAANSVPGGGGGMVSFTLNIANGVTAPAGSAFTLTVTNDTSRSNRTVDLSPYVGSNYSRVELNSATIINVDSVQPYDAAYSGGIVTSSFVRGSTAYIRAVVSDPFGSFDISSSTITLRNPSGTDVVTAAMSQVNDSGAATKIL